jgi:GNAT superfamily N-acetyltransferase
MIEVVRTDSTNGDFIKLVQQLDAYLAVIDGDEHAFYAQFNKTAALKYVVVLYEDAEAVGCGAIKPFGIDAMEVKRMFILPEKRGQGLAKTVLSELERWTKQLHFTRCVLETGKRQQDAVRLYQSAGYSIVPNYGQYAEMENSVCFEKIL